MGSSPTLVRAEGKIKIWTGLNQAQFKPYLVVFQLIPIPYEQKKICLTPIKSPSKTTHLKLTSIAHMTYGFSQKNLFLASKERSGIKLIHPSFCYERKGKLLNLNKGFTYIEIVIPQIGIRKFYFQTNHNSINLPNKTFEIKKVSFISFPSLLCVCLFLNKQINKVGIRLSKITFRDID